MNFLDIATCTEHGWFGHVGVHEAGHATAAILLDFNFLDVSIGSSHNTLAQMTPGAQLEAGGLRPATDQPTEWIGPRPEDALILLLAGSLAEQEIMGHYIEDGYSRDFEIWRWGTGLEGANDPSEVAPLIKEGTTSARKMVAENRAAILRVYQLFVDRAPTDGHSVCDFSEPLVLAPDEVRAAVLKIA